MTNLDISTDVCMEKLNEIFTNFLRLYLFCTEASVRVGFEDDVYGVPYFIIDDTQYPVYLDIELALKAYKVADASKNAKTLLTATENGFEYNHVLLMTGSGALQAAFEKAMKASCIDCEPIAIALRCVFEVDGVHDFGSYDKLKSVKLCGLAFWVLRETACDYLTAIKKQGEILELAWSHVAAQGQSMDFDILRGEVIKVLHYIDAIAANLSQRQLQLSHYNSLKPLLAAINP
jgi:hypothetical protein